MGAARRLGRVLRGGGGPAVRRQSGSGAFAGLTITANILMSLVIDQFGLFGAEQHALGVGRSIGAGLMVAGIALIAKF